MCVITGHTPLYIAVWASPVHIFLCMSQKWLMADGSQILFELLVLIFTVVNAFDRPRTAQARISAALHRDGATYFVVS